MVVLRDAAAGLEVYLVKRSRAVDFMAGAHVFPGGRLDPADSSLEACAVRETGEEAALVLDPATAKSIEMLLAFASVEAALAEAVRRPPPVVMPVVWNDKESGHAYISLPGDPRHPSPDVLGGKIRRFQLAEGRYRRVNAR